MISKNKWNIILIKWIVVILFMQINYHGFGQSTDHKELKDKIYHWGLKDHKTLLIGSATLWGGSLYLMNNSDKIKLEDLPFRERDNIWAIDRGATFNYSVSAAEWSDKALYLSVALPFTYFLTGKGREEGKAIAGMMLEGFLINGGITNVLKATTGRFRPLTYNEDVPLDERLDSGSRFSFISGHTSNAAFASFFTAKVFGDFYPDSKWKPYVWATAATLPALTAYFRYEAGKHFPTDLVAGYALGAFVGYIIPHIHKKEHDHFSLQPTQFFDGFSLSYNRKF
jgi:membrane-associated phospholipid phosphatase